MSEGSRRRLCDVHACGAKAKWTVFGCRTASPGHSDLILIAACGGHAQAAMTHAISDGFDDGRMYGIEEYDAIEREVDDVWPGAIMQRGVA